MEPMGARGPKPESNVVRMLKGNPGHRRPVEQPELPPPGAELASPPRRLKGAAAGEWTRLYEQLVSRGVVHAGNVMVFEEYCYVLGELRRLENLSKRISADMAIMRGYLKAAAVLRQQLRQLARDLGLTVLAGEKVGQNESKLAKFVRPAS